jgi:hypothetical protein
MCESVSAAMYENNLVDRQPRGCTRPAVQHFVVTPQEQIAEAEILGFLARGGENSAALRERNGKPIDLDAYFATPPDVRMAFSMLKGAEVVPEELELLKEINRLEADAAACEDGTIRAALRRTISELYALYDMKMQTYRRKVAL